MIALELIDKLFLTSICVVALFGVIGALTFGVFYVIFTAALGI